MISDLKSIASETLSLDCYYHPGLRTPDLRLPQAAFHRAQAYAEAIIPAPPGFLRSSVHCLISTVLPDHSNWCVVGVVILT